MSRAGENMLMGRHQQMATSFQIGTPQTSNAKLPFSFKAACESIEDEIRAL